MNDINVKDFECQSHEHAEDIHTPHLQIVQKGRQSSLYISGQILELTDNFDEAGLLAYFLKWFPYSTDPDGWIYVSYTSKYETTQTICRDLKISRGRAMKAVNGLEQEEYIKTESRWVPGTRVKRLYVLVNQDNPFIAAELAEQEKRRSKRKRRKLDSDFRRSVSDFEQSNSDFEQSDGDFDLHNNQISKTHSVETREEISDLDKELIHQWLRTIDTARTRSDAIAYVQKRLVEGHPNPELAERLSELRLNAQTQSGDSLSSEPSQFIAERRALYQQITGGDA